MITLKSLPTLALAAALVAPSTASAVDVEITFQNLSNTENAVYSYTNSGESVTYTYANPKPSPTVEHGHSNIYTVGNPTTNLVTGAHVRYTMGSKRCIFHSSYTGTPSGSNIIPNWTKSTESSGGAVCTANITYTNASNFNWKVTFTMK